MTSILEGQPPQNEAFPYQNKAHLGFRYILVTSRIYIYIYVVVSNMFLCSPLFGEDDPILTDIFQMG